MRRVQKDFLAHVLVTPTLLVSYCLLLLYMYMFTETSLFHTCILKPCYSKPLNCSRPSRLGHAHGLIDSSLPVLKKSRCSVAFVGPERSVVYYSTTCT